MWMVLTDILSGIRQKLQQMCVDLVKNINGIV